MTRQTARVQAAAVVAALAALPALAALATGPTYATAPAAPTLLLPNMVVAEGNAGKGAFVVNVGLSEPNPLDHAVSVQVVDFSTTPVPGGGGQTYGTARPGQDYVAFSPFRLTFKPGQQVARFTVKLKGDTVPEGNEEIDVRFDDTELTVGDNDIDLVLADDDTAPAAHTKPLLLLPNQVMPEPDQGCLTYQVSVLTDRAVATASTVDAVDYTSVPLPGGGTYGTAQPGSDYVTFGTRTLTFAAGTRATKLPVSICGDTAVEGNEEIDVRFDNTTKLAVGDNDIDLVLASDD